jgi:hypothetical protein
MLVNVRAYQGGGLIYEVNPYDTAAGTLKGLDYPYLGQGLPAPQPLGAKEAHIDELIYEMKPSSTLTGEPKTFHFALADGRYKDKRIPPKGFGIVGEGETAEFDEAVVNERLSLPVGTDYTVHEYEGGYDEVSLTIPSGADYVEVNLHYQHTSREHIELLRDEIVGNQNQTLPDPNTSRPENEAYLIQGDGFFAKLAAWGDTIWNLWTHNMNVDGAAPFLMAQATTGVPTSCDVGAPSLDALTPGHTQVTIDWSAVGGATGYKVYYDQAGKARLVADAGDAARYIDTGLTNGVEYCSKVTAYNATCESGCSNILCATPTNQGQTTDPAGVDLMQTGLWTGKGKNQQFVTGDSFAAGDTVVVRAQVHDGVDENNNPIPIANATVEITIGGPETVTLNSNPSDADGWAEANWQTRAPNRKGAGGTATGSYTATTTNVTGSGYDWDSVTTGTTFTLQ